MPGEVLTGEPYAGFFGKLPSAGDFVARGISPAFRRAWDAFVTRHIAPLAAGGGWPDGGLRFRLVSGGRVAAGVVVPSRDAAGRRFPLSLILAGESLPGPEGLDAWCDLALAAAGPALEGADGPDALWAALDILELPGDGAGAGGAAMLVWARGTAPVAVAPEAPGAAIAGLVGAGPGPGPDAGTGR
ncbi:MAG: type VI secretion system-associated protein TagF [Paracoccaceae bacterium]